MTIEKYQEPSASVVQRKETFDAEARQVIRDMYAKGATDGEFAALMATAEARQLNPLLKQIYFVKRYDTQLGRDVWSCQVSIDGLRVVAERSGEYDGQDEPEFVHDASGKVELCRVKIYRKGITRPFVGVAYWSEYVQVKKDGRPTQFWDGKPHVMLSKCAEAIGMRKAFPHDTSGLYVAEEMQSGEVVERADVRVIEPTAGGKGTHPLVQEVRDAIDSLDGSVSFDQAAEIRNDVLDRARATQDVGVMRDIDAELQRAANIAVAAEYTREMRSREPMFNELRRMLETARDMETACAAYDEYGRHPDGSDTLFASKMLARQVQMLDERADVKRTNAERAEAIRVEVARAQAERLKGVAAA